MADPGRAAGGGGPSFSLLITLVFVITLAPMCVETYIPALPDVAREFNADIEVVQLTLSVYLFGFAVSHLVYGPAADHFGRKPTMFWGLALFLLSTVGCALSTTLPVLILFRLLQAIGVSSVIIIPRAIVRDLYGPEDSARALSYVSLSMGIAPVIAPILGSLIVSRFSWHAVFWLIAAYGLVVTAAFRAFVPESIPERSQVGFSFTALMRSKATLLSDRRFVGYLLCISCVSGGMFAFISLCSFVLVDHMGVPKEQFGYLYALAIIGFIIGTASGGRLSGRIASRRLIALGLWLIILGAALMYILAVSGVMRPAALIGPHFIFLCGLGLLMPQCYAAAMAPVPHIAATASALLGFVQVGSSAVLVTVLGFFQEGGQVVIALVMAVSALLAVTAFAGLVVGRSPLRPQRPA